MQPNVFLIRYKILLFKGEKRDTSSGGENIAKEKRLFKMCLKRICCFLAYI